MAEFNIPPAPAVKGQGAGAFSTSIQRMGNYLRTYFSQRGLDVMIDAAVKFQPQDLHSPQARTFGCDPDYNAWTMTENEIDTLNPTLREFRFSGGHLHVSYLREGALPAVEDQLRVVRALDYFLGPQLILIEPGSAKIRRQFYGRAGAFRLKPYGIEYRVPSCAWIANHDIRVDVYSLIAETMDWLSHRPEEQLDDRLEDCREWLSELINTARIRMAEGAIRKPERFRGPRHGPLPQSVLDF